MIKALEYPFDSASLLRQRRKYRRELLADGTKRTPKKIAVLGGSTTHDIVDMLELFLLQMGIAPTFYESEYARFWQDAVFDAPELVAFSPDLILIHVTYRNLSPALPPLDAPENATRDAIDSEEKRYIQMWEHLREKYHCPIIQNNFELPSFRVLGNRDAWDCHGTTYAVNEINRCFAAYAASHDNFYLHDLNYFAATVGLDKWHEPSAWYLYKYPFPVSLAPDLAYSYTRIIRSLWGHNRKLIVLDCDNTLWGGVIGDDGVENIAIGNETAQGEAYREFQSYCQVQTEIGVALAICSKNEPESVALGLNHPDSLLHENDFAIIEANWDRKDTNIGKITATLSLLPESVVFVDDNPAERDIVATTYPEIAAPPFATPFECLYTLDRAGYFEVTTLSADDKTRTKMYRENAKRAELQQSFTDYTDYLKSLNMIATLEPFTPLNLPRIAQLTQKSNQFNLTTRRYRQEELTAFSADKNYICLCGRLRDRFGDNGIVSVVVAHADAENNYHIDLWLMSCRVLKRDMELCMLDELVAQLKERDASTVYGYYYKTPKNNMVASLYETFGFKKISETDTGDSVWRLNVAEYAPKNHVITLEAGTPPTERR